MLTLLILAIGGYTIPGCGTQSGGAEDEDAGFHSIFDEESLDDWDYDTTYWRLEEGVLVGEVKPETILKRNSFIIHKHLVTRDFELKVEYRVTSHGNSGINYRSARIDSLPYAMAGYQADIDGENRWTGQNYEERGRTFLALRGQRVVLDPGFEALPYDSIVKLHDPVKDSLARFIKPEQWNEYHLVVKGNLMRHFINGALMSEVIDADTVHARSSGLFGVQVHVGPPMKIEYRNFKIKEL